jgi:general stress protein 26
MSTVDNLSTESGIKKIKELVKDANICMFITNISDAPLTGRPMSTADVDEEGNIWFFSKMGSDKNIDIARDNRVQLFYCNKGSSEYLSVYGTAEIIHNKGTIDELWTPIAKAWFHEGKDDPTITAIKVTPEDAYYWDTKGTKMVSLLKIAIGAVTGKPMDVGVEGKIELHNN